MSATPARLSARDRLLDAAEALFYEQGIAATGVDAILRRAEVAPATLYAHFAGKDGLVAAYLERRLDRWRGTWDEALGRAGDDADARAVAVFDALAEFRPGVGPRRGCAFLAASVEVTRPEHPAHAWLVADTRLLHERLLALAADTGTSDPAALAAELLALYDGVLAARARDSLLREAPESAPEPARAARDLALAAVERHRG
ncbi:TetR family transcriptional regulator [Serinibacter arcticus]|uniref:TetR family transcriptional regulator n=1 Tax=Serinibacter arcticus TaxID=1655435 RepID=A0A2U1ZXS7_9MICO|nr:TetR/AcrR family transcriptional regulator [Serinibacter arcticus]PWD51795.1 TetR family transcriptional regulator [Serinibacter arcticus]